MEAYRRTVLYIEDDAVNMTLMRHIFRKYLPAVLLLEAETAELGLRIAMREPLDLILLDIGLPGLDGYAAMNVLRSKEETRHIPVLGVSAFAQNADMERARVSGFAGYITKPFQVRLLAEAVESLLAGRAHVFIEDKIR
ncbi:response regulator [Paenibacillus tepidiphilus]|uniref:response regulator n=1 Tax=Paenibacillus tepidiphilus TaxID=2608683 RepID=UPI001238E20F|nr:response regulator [Paenibacillus tepidiphilus]